MSAVDNTDGDIASRRRRNECSQAEQPGLEKLRLCSRCKWVYYCSTECQKKNWRSHKLSCKQDHGALTSEDKEEIMLLRKWVYSHVNFARGVYLNALDVGNHPENVDTQALVVQLKRTPQKGKPRHEAFDINCAGVITMHEAEGMFKGEGDEDAVVEEMKHKRQELKRNGRLGIGWLVITVANTRLQVWSHMKLSDLGDARRNTITNFWGQDFTKLARFTLENLVEDYPGSGAERVAPSDKDIQAFNRRMRTAKGEVV